MRLRRGNPCANNRLIGRQIPSTMHARRDNPYANNRLIVRYARQLAFHNARASRQTMGEPSPNHLGDLPPCIWANHRLVFVHMQKKQNRQKKRKTSFFDQNLHQYGVGLPNRVPTPLRRSKNETGALPELTSLSYLVKFQATT